MYDNRPRIAVTTNSVVSEVLKKRRRYRMRYIYRPFLVLALITVLIFSVSFFDKGLLGKWGPYLGRVVGDAVAGAATATGILPNNAGLNILIIGNNARDAGNALSLGTAGGQADILIVAHINVKKHQITLISVPRDTLIAMPGWNEPIPKIKCAFYLGLQTNPADGPAMAMKYVSGLTGMPISNYVAIDFHGFEDAVNAVHGIRIDVPARLYDPLHSGANLYPGWQILNGEEALAYVRIRQNEAGNGYRINDFQRQRAELQVLDALKKKVYDSYSNISELSKLIQILNKDVTTNLNMRQIISLADEALSWHVNHVYLGSDKDAMDILGASVSGLNNENYLTGAYYDVLDPAKVHALLKPYGASAPDSVLPALPPADSIPVAVYGPSIVVGQLKDAGFTSIDYRGPSGNVAQDTIIYPPGELYRGLVVGRCCGSGNEVVEPGPPGLQKVLYLVPGNRGMSAGAPFTPQA